MPITPESELGEVGLQQNLRVHPLEMAAGASASDIARRTIEVLCASHKAPGRVDMVYEEPEKMPDCCGKHCVFCMLNDLWLSKIDKQALSRQKRTFCQCRGRPLAEQSP